MRWSFFRLSLLIIGVFSIALSACQSQVVDPTSTLTNPETYSVTQTPVPTPTVTITTPTQTAKPSNTPFQPEAATPTQVDTPVPTTTSSPTHTPTNTPTPPPEASIEGIKGRWSAYALDCEVRSAVDWAAYFGFEIDEIEFFNRLPVSDNPDHGFVGDVNGSWGSTPPDSYGVHAKPIAKLLQSYGLPAQAVRNMSWDQLRAEIATGQPVIVWVIGRIGLGTPVAYTSSDGHETIVARFEHTVIVIAYNKHRVTVLDGYWVYDKRLNDFLDSWEVLGNMAVVWDD
jgi:uncharacterized protein YvpB